MNEHQQTRTLSPDDPKLTAYALGELNGAERTEVEAILKSDPAARAAVEEIRALAAQLEGALATEAVDENLASAGASETARRGAVFAKAAKGVETADDPYRKKIVRFPYVWVGAAAAACFAVVVALREGGAGRSEEKFVAESAGNKAGVAESRSVSERSAPALAEKKAGTFSVDTATATRGQSAPMVFLVQDEKEAARLPAPEPAAHGGMRAENLAEKTDAPPTLAAAAVSAAPTVSVTEPAPSLLAITSSEYSAVPSGEVVMLSPFEVRDILGGGGYHASSTAAGSRRERSDQSEVVSAMTATSQARGYESPRMNFRAKSTVPARSQFNTENYAFLPESDFFRVRSTPLSTFSVDVDTASYANVRRFLDQGQRPPRDAVRVEEMVNYFNYRYAPPAKDVKEPFAASMEIATAPWNPAHRLVRIGLKGREIATEDRPAANLVFLLDVSGSMSDENKLPLVKESLRLLVDKLRADDRVAIVTYAGNSGLVLPSTAVARKKEILEALDALSPGGSTNGAMGIELAYAIAKANFIADGANRVILCTDGDFNVGTSSDGELTRLIEEKAKSGVFLTVLGFGMGNLKDSTLERLADKGNGSYGYIDSRAEAQKLLVEEAGATLVTIAKDVKLQVEFNPAVAQAYRLIGYENRALKKEDFNNDRVDAGEIGAGHTVTALYEIVPVGAPAPESPAAGEVDALKYQKNEPVVAASAAAADVDRSNPESRAGNAEKAVAKEELLTLKIRFKEPMVDVSRKIEIPVIDTGAAFEAASKDFKFAAAVASLGMMLRESVHAGQSDYDRIISWAEAGKGDDADGKRGEFIELVKKARTLSAE